MANQDQLSMFAFIVVFKRSVFCNKDYDLAQCTIENCVSCQKLSPNLSFILSSCGPILSLKIVYLVRESLNLSFILSRLYYHYFKDHVIT